MIELEYSPKFHIQALYRSIALVYYDFESMSEHYRPAANMEDFDIRKWRKVRFNECIRQINLIRESKSCVMLLVENYKKVQISVITGMNMKIVMAIFIIVDNSQKIHIL